MANIEENKERVRRMLKEAFANVPCPYEKDACGLMFHEEAVVLRSDFYNLTPEQIHYDLPHILEDLMDTRTGDEIETEDAEYLVMQLNPMGSDDAVVRRIRLEQYANFTRDQAQAVCEWLRLARTWQDLKRFTEWTDAAIDYWHRRASK